MGTSSTYEVAEVYSNEPFENRKKSGKLLGAALKALSGKDTVVLGILRGGMVIAREISRLSACRI